MKYYEQRYLVLNSIYISLILVYVIIYIIISIYSLIYKNSKLINGIYAGDFHLIYSKNILPYICIVYI